MAQQAYQSLVSASRLLQPRLCFRCATRRTHSSTSVRTFRRRWRELAISSAIAAAALLAFAQSHNQVIRHDGPPMQTTSLAEVDEVTKRRMPIDRRSPMRLRMEALILEHQNRIVFALEDLDGSKFRRDEWSRPHGGGGVSCVLQDGNVFEKAGVNTSIVYGELPRAAIEKMRADHKSFVDPNIEKMNFFAAGISLVLHPHNPMAPTVHLNYRYFETSDPRDPVNATGTAQQNWWFGGGTDLTPSYLFEEDATHFHKTIKAACDKHDKSYYRKFKQWCDNYFRIPHRNESRGVGGIFFDDLDETAQPAAKDPREENFQFCVSGLEAFLPSYLPIIKRRKDMPYLPRHKEWQQVRRGRYVEFNLVNDRGTSFGLRTPGARIESILMSLPLTARWEYMHPISGTGVDENGEGDDGTSDKEKELMMVLREPREWA
jgi:coproporphyrinogen III oxidase